MYYKKKKTLAQFPILVANFHCAMGTWISFWGLFLAPLDLVPTVWMGNYNQAKGFLVSRHSSPCNCFQWFFF